MKKQDEMNQLKKFMIEEEDFIKYAKMNEKHIDEFLRFQYDNDLINYLDKKYLDVSYLIIENNLIDLDMLWLDFKSYIDEMY